ncbi:hypothetical protein PSN45_004926 [Yamadazyma tenuis]|nr:hypothetical protein PSN45_004926 [Yamadazyma tenuis]
MTVSIESKSATAEGSSHESSASPIYIPGTTIKLETDEDIQKWIAERRKNWPSTKNLERKQQEKHSDKKRKLQEEPSTSSPTTKKPRQICRFYQNNKSCRFGDNCKNMHESETDFKMINNMKVKVPKSFENNYYVKENASENMSLYKMLVKKDQFELENDKFIEFLYYLDKKGLIKHTFNDIPT